MAVLKGFSVVEVSAFVAAPLGGMTLAQLGAEIIRIDPIGGGIDYDRWPLAPNGASLYWAGLNKGKRSVALALHTPEGREIATAIITAASGDGVLLTNLPESGWLSYRQMAARRADMIMLRLLGNHDGTTAVDYTVNCASGFPLATGRGDAPVNHVLPAWDIAAGLYIATGLLAADRHRSRTGQGQEITVALSDVMLAAVGNLGYIADVQVNGHVRPPLGNDLYGAFGRDFATRDGRRVMIVAISTRQWKALCQATGLADRMALIEPMLDVDLTKEGGRFKARDAIAAVLAPWFEARGLAEVEAALSGSGVLWGVYRDFRQLVAEDPRCSPANPMLAMVEQPGIGPYLMPGSPLSFGGTARVPPRPAPRLGEHTTAVLADIVGLSAAEIGRLHDRGIIADPPRS